MKIFKTIKKLSLLLILCIFSLNIHSEQIDSSYNNRNFSSAFYTISKNIIINSSIYGFDRIVGLGEPHPFKKGIEHLNINRWTFDNSLYSTNFIGHPYHGALYHENARSSGLTYYESIPFNILGSLMWELGAEKERPSINDIIVTPLTGAAVGESLYRISNLFYSGQKTTLKEIGGFIFNPINGLERIITNNYKYYNKPVKYQAYINVGYQLFDNQPIINVGIEYGNILESNKQPFEYFNDELILSYLNNKIFLKELHINGKLYSRQLNDYTNLGLWQYFNNWCQSSDRDIIKPNYMMSESVSYGVGLVNEYLDIKNQLHLSYIVLGSFLSDYININRQYNFGTGFSLKEYFSYDLGFAKLNINYDLYKMNSIHEKNVNIKTTSLHNIINTYLYIKLTNSLRLKVNYMYLNNKIKYDNILNKTNRSFNELNIGLIKNINNNI